VETRPFVADQSAISPFLGGLLQVGNMEMDAATLLRKEIDRAVTAGQEGISPACLASIKGLVRADPVHAPKVALETLLLHLKASHSQVRQAWRSGVCVLCACVRACLCVCVCV